MPVVDVTPKMTFEVRNWRWRDDAARKDALRKPPETIRMEVYSTPIQGGWRPPEDALEDMAATVQKAAAEALARRTGHYRQNLRAVQWTIGFFPPAPAAGFAWADCNWKLFDREEPGEPEIATFTVFHVQD